MRKISESKQSAIFLGYHERTGSTCCLKRTALQDLKRTGLADAIREHKIQQFVCHPHLVRGFCSAIDAAHLYLLMEFMDGETLGRELRGQVLRSMSEQGTAKARINDSVTTQISKINKIRRILFEVVSAVAYLH